MKKIILFLLFFLSLHIYRAQDTIIKIYKKDIIVCSVTAVSPLKIFYTENKIEKSILKSDVSYFTRHESGKKEATEESEKLKYRIILSDKFALQNKYSFSIVQVIDGRLNKAKPIGSVVGSFGFNQQYVGNDSLSENMNLFFKKNNKLFDTVCKIVMVLNQLHLRYLGGYSMGSGKIEDLEISISIDYYKLNGITCELIYQQFNKYERSVKFIAKQSKAINLTYFETIESALNGFNTQLRSNKLVNIQTMPLDSLINLYSGK